jgi:glucose/arabinose dehydrogenase
MAFLPDGNILVTERTGRLRIIENGKLNPQPVSGLPEIAVTGQGGLLDVALHPDFENNRWVYLSYAARGEDGYGTEVVRGRLEGMELKAVEKIFAAVPKSMEGGRHFGSRLLFVPDGLPWVIAVNRIAHRNLMTMQVR